MKNIYGLILIFCVILSIVFLGVSMILNSTNELETTEVLQETNTVEIIEEK